MFFILKNYIRTENYLCTCMHKCQVGKQKAVFTFSYICNLCWSDYWQLVYIYAKRLVHMAQGRQTCKYTYTDTAGHVKGCSMTRYEAKIDCHQQLINYFDQSRCRQQA